MPMTSHDQKCHVASQFDHLDLTKGMMPLMDCWCHVILIHASVALHVQKHYVAHLLVLLTMTLASHDANFSAKCQMTEKGMLHLILINLT